MVEIWNPSSDTKIFVYLPVWIQQQMWARKISLQEFETGEQFCFVKSSVPLLNVSAGYLLVDRMKIVAAYLMENYWPSFRSCILFFYCQMKELRVYVKISPWNSSCPSFSTWMNMCCPSRAHILHLSRQKNFIEIYPIGMNNLDVCFKPLWEHKWHVYCICHPP